MVRDNVEHHAEARVVRRVAQRAKGGRSTEIAGDSSRVDTVVPVCRTRSRLLQRREVEVADPELTKVRHVLFGRLKGQQRTELKAVSRAELRAHGLPKSAVSTSGGDGTSTVRTNTPVMLRLVVLGAKNGSVIRRLPPKDLSRERRAASPIRSPNCSGDDRCSPA